jgi:hypothetical protein
MEKKDFKGVLLLSFLLTLAIFTSGLVANYFFDVQRLNLLDERVASAQLSMDSYFLERALTRQFDVFCFDSKAIQSFQNNLRDFGADLDRYTGKALFKGKDFQNLRREYYLLETELYLSMLASNERCGTNFVPILFFFEEGSNSAINQGFVLSNFVTRHEAPFFVFTFEMSYVREPVIGMLASNFDITKTPAVVMGSRPISNGRLVTEDDLNMYAGLLNHSVDPYAKSFDMEFTLKAAGVKKERFLSLLANATPVDAFARADSLLVRGRITKNDTLICRAHTLFQTVSGSAEIRALALESAASLNCANSSALYGKASLLWKEAGFGFREEIDRALAESRSPNIPFLDYNFSAGIEVPSNASSVIIGSSSITVSGSDVIVTQVDRVHRDWLSGQLFQSPDGPVILKTFSERLYYNKSELRSDIGWHEGGRLADTLSAVNASYFAATGTVTKRFGNAWYATNENGTAMFEVPKDKLLYPTTRFLQEDIAVLVDTHGVNMLVAQAIIKNASVVLSDCDHPGKVKAAVYLSERGIRTICFPDRFLYQALGRSGIIGSPPFEVGTGTITFGNRSVQIGFSEPIVVVNASVDKYALWYYTTPASYFTELQKYVSLNVTYVVLTDFNQMDSVVREAQALNSHVIASRVFNSNDYYHLSRWLNESKYNRLVLFHSTSYPYGVLISSQFPSQVSFDDQNPRFD